MVGMSFKQHEIDYLTAADLGRLATVAPDGTPQNSPVGFTYNAELGTIDIAGYHMSRSRKFRNIKANDAVAFVVDDIASRDPWRVRCLEIRGTAEQAELPSAPTRTQRRRVGFRDHPDHPAAHHQLRHRRHRNRAASAPGRQPRRRVASRYSGQRMKSSCDAANGGRVRPRRGRHGRHADVPVSSRAEARRAGTWCGPGSRRPVAGSSRYGTRARASPVAHRRTR